MMRRSCSHFVFISNNNQCRGSGGFCIDHQTVHGQAAQDLVKGADRTSSRLSHSQSLFRCLSRHSRRPMRQRFCTNLLSMIPAKLQHRHHRRVGFTFCQVPVRTCIAASQCSQSHAHVPPVKQDGEGYRPRPRRVSHSAALPELRSSFGTRQRPPRRDVLHLSHVCDRASM